eukprot:TRINITY_DN9113_c0_g1_i1.p1 TRINITY_DN9113_c0_g1~~TRINITY_DN9113_c0_g1_i1.p1  ORF type:complete len:695 (+),score=147.57 TRINITY_DN9113_c0_g1_i1:86-2170(+)
MEPLFDAGWFGSARAPRPAQWRGAFADCVVAEDPEAQLQREQRRERWDVCEDEEAGRGRIALEWADSLADFLPSPEVQRRYRAVLRLLRGELATKVRRRDQDAIEAFVALGGEPNLSGEIQSQLLRSSVKSFGLTIDIDSLILDADTDGSGLLDFDEFKAMFDVVPGAGSESASPAHSVAPSADPDSDGQQQRDRWGLQPEPDTNAVPRLAFLLGDLDEVFSECRSPADDAARLRAARFAADVVDPCALPEYLDFGGAAPSARYPAGRDFRRRRRRTGGNNSRRGTQSHGAGTPQCRSLPHSGLAQGDLILGAPPPGRDRRSVALPGSHPPAGLLCQHAGPPGRPGSPPVQGAGAESPAGGSPQALAAVPFNTAGRYGIVCDTAGPPEWAADAAALAQLTGELRRRKPPKGPPGAPPAKLPPSSAAPAVSPCTASPKTVCSALPTPGLSERAASSRGPQTPPKLPSSRSAARRPPLPSSAGGLPTLQAPRAGTPPLALRPAHTVVLSSEKASTSFPRAATAPPGHTAALTPKILLRRPRGRRRRPPQSASSGWSVGAVGWGSAAGRPTSSRLRAPEDPPERLKVYQWSTEPEWSVSLVGATQLQRKQQQQPGSPRPALLDGPERSPAPLLLPPADRRPASCTAPAASRRRIRDAAKQQGRRLARLGRRRSPWEARPFEVPLQALIATPAEACRL